MESVLLSLQMLPDELSLLLSSGGLTHESVKELQSGCFKGVLAAVPIASESNNIIRCILSDFFRCDSGLL